jgi:hypothetical protein
MDDSLLRKTEGSIDDPHAYTTWVEYCLLECDGPAHTSRHPDAPGLFCAKHIHRSGSGLLKEPVCAEAIAAILGS